MKQHLPKILLGLSILAVLVSVGFRVYVFNTYSTTGEEIKGYESEIAKLQKENQSLREQVSADSSLLNIKDKALSMGMLDSTSTVFLTPAPAAAVITANDSSTF